MRARHRVIGEAPSEVYIVSNGKSHRLYSSIGAARGVRTRERNEDIRYHSRNDPDRWKIYKLVVDDNLEEIDG